MQVEFLEQLGLDDGGHAITKQRAVGHDDRCTATTLGGFLAR